MGQGFLFTVQIEQGVAQPVVPQGVLLSLVCDGLQKGDGLFQRPGLLGPGQVVVGPGQLAGELIAPLRLGDGLDGVDDPLILVLLVPALKLAEQFRIQVLHIWNLLLLTLSGAGCQARLAR